MTADTSMSSNKIGFLTALGVYVPLIAMFLFADFSQFLAGERGKSVAFSISLDNIGGGSPQAPQAAPKAEIEKPKMPPKPKTAPKKREKPKPLNPVKRTESKPIAPVTPAPIPAAVESPVDSAQTAQTSDSVESAQAVDSADSQSADSASGNPATTKGDSGAGSGFAGKTQLSSGEYNAYFAKIKKIIDRHHSQGEVRNLTGSVEVGFLITRDGALERLSVLRSSGSARLEEISKRTIRRASRSFPNPPEDYYMKILLVYKR